MVSISTTVILNCSNSSPTKIKDSYSEDKIYIVDRTGKKWDITHAVKEYGMDRDKFNYGLGPNAIPPILNPQFLAPGDDGYPPSSQTFRVVGTTVSGESRAYRVSDLSCREVVDDQFGATPVVVTY